MYDLNLIKSRINCVTYAQRVGLPIKSSGDRCISPFRDGAKNPTSFVVHDDFYFDFSAGTGGDVIEFCANYSHHGDRGAAIRELATLTGVASDNTGNTEEWLEYTKHMNAMTAYYHTQLTDADRGYLYNRGLSDADIDRLMIGRVTDGPLRGRLFLPYFSGHDGYVCYYATRALPGSAFPDSKYMKQKRDDHCQHLPWGLQTLNRDGDTLVIAEGYFDAAAYEILGYPVLSAITGRFSKSQLPVVLSVARKFKRVFIVYDNDDVSHAGESFAHTMSLILTQNRIPFVVGTVPPPYHDISDYYAAGGDISKIITTAEDGLFYIATRFREFESLEKFMYSISRYTKRPRLEELFQRVKQTNRWNEKTLAALCKSCTTAPPETLIADEILHDHQLVYVNSIGFYEYDHGVWNRRSDTQISGYADRAYGEFSTNQRVKAITGLLKTRALDDVTFDRAPVWNFINGTLELDTGVFRDHNPGDYCSVQASYPYDPKSTYDAWTKFIDDVTAGDPKAAELLQLIPGYALGYPDNRLERIFVLTGSGGNGKSKYLEILRQLFGSEHVSHLQPRALLDKFQVIQLQHSLINIAGEIKSNFADVEERMKAIASGEPISGCFKGEQFVTFAPRTKLVFATNSEVTSGDTSEGLTRRLIIVNFKVSFVDYPDPSDPYQRLKNTDILDQLTTELQSGGIFNWAYEGYKLLRAVGYFTETDDQAQLIQDFKRSSNPVLVFWEDFQYGAPDSISNADLYYKYNQWCCENGERSSSAAVFHREFKRVSQGFYSPYRKNSERGYHRDR